MLQGPYSDGDKDIGREGRAPDRSRYQIQEENEDVVDSIRSSGAISRGVQEMVSCHSQYCLALCSRV